LNFTKDHHHHYHTSINLQQGNSLTQCSKQEYQLDHSGNLVVIQNPVCWGATVRCKLLNDCVYESVVSNSSFNYFSNNMSFMVNINQYGLFRTEMILHQKFVPPAPAPSPSNMTSGYNMTLAAAYMACGGLIFFCGLLYAVRAAYYKSPNHNYAEGWVTEPLPIADATTLDLAQPFLPVAIAAESTDDLQDPDASLPVARRANSDLELADGRAVAIAAPIAMAESASFAAAVPAESSLPIAVATPVPSDSDSDS
jgi:hypothetical protein